MSAAAGVEAGLAPGGPGSMPDARVRAEESGARALALALRSVAVAETGRRGLILRPARLPPALATPKLRQALRIALEPLLSADRARLFRLPDQAMVVLWRGEGRPFQHETLEALARVTAELPAGTAETAGLIATFELPRDTAAMEAVVAEALAALRAGRPDAAPRSEAPTVAPLDLGALTLLERALAQADVAHLARRRPVCTAAEPGNFRLAWEKRTLSVAELAATLVPHHSPEADPWLFRRLTRALDRRMLALLSHRGELDVAGPFSLNLNVASVLSPHFTRFDTALPQRLRGAVILEFLPEDLLADPASFRLARDLAHGRGYQLLLRRVTPLLLPVLPLAALGLDWLELRWSAETAREGARLLAATRTDPGKILLAGADHQDAVAWALDQGITHLKGHLVAPTAGPGSIRAPR